MKSRWLQGILDKRNLLLSALFLVLTGISCTSTRWVIKEKQAVDTTDYEVVSQTPILKKTKAVTPQNPVLQLDIYSKNRMHYSQKILAERYIQEYRPKWGFLTAGLLVGGFTLYATQSDQVLESPTPTQKLLLNGAGGLISVSSMLNMKSTGSPIRTGETRYLKNTGVYETIDTLRSNFSDIPSASFTISSDDSLLVPSRNLNVTDSSLHINLLNYIDPGRFASPEPGSLRVSVDFGSKTYTYDLSVSSFLTPYVNITSNIAELRDSPATKKRNILIDLARGSELKLIEPVKKEWYKVYYGITPTYVRKNDVQITWRPYSFEQEKTVVTIPKKPYGEIDVEKSFPVFANNVQQGMGLIVANEHYSKPFETYRYALRDARLINTYLNKSFGFKESGIYSLKDLQDKSEVFYTLGRMSESVERDTTRLIVYFSGRAVIREVDGESKYYLLPAGSDHSESPPVNQLIDLGRVLSELGTLETRYTVVFADIEFEKGMDVDLDAPALQDFGPLGRLADNLTSKNPNSGILFSSRIAQSSELYYKKEQEVDKKHRIFPYFLAKGIQQRYTNLGNLVNFMERNVTFTSRKLHDRAQDPQFFGNRNIDLIPRIP